MNQHLETVQRYIKIYIKSLYLFETKLTVAGKTDLCGKTPFSFANAKRFCDDLQLTFHS